jgi:diaminopimelate decarboxylase
MSRYARTHSLHLEPAARHKFGSTHEDAAPSGVAESKGAARDRRFERAAALPGLRVVGSIAHFASQIIKQRLPLRATLPRSLLDLCRNVAAAVLQIGPRVDAAAPAGHHLPHYAPRRIAAGAPSALIARSSCRSAIDERGHGHRKLPVRAGRFLFVNAGLLAA